MATVREMLQRTVDKLDDTSFSTSKLLAWFNDCQNEITNILFLPKEVYLTRNEDGAFSLPSDFIEEIDLYSVPEDVPLERVKVGTKDLGYYIINNEIHVNGYSGDTLRMIYKRKPTEIRNDPDQVPDIPAQFHVIYEFYACAMAMLSDEEHERFNYFNTQYTKTYALLKSYMERQRTSYSYGDLPRWEVIR